MEKTSHSWSLVKGAGGELILHGHSFLLPHMIQIDGLRSLLCAREIRLLGALEWPETSRPTSGRILIFTQLELVEQSHVGCTT